MEKQEQLNVVIVDDNPMVLSTLDEMINAEDGLTVIGKADNGEDAIDMIKDTTPDIVLLDMVMTKVDGITIVEKFNHRDTFRKHPVFIMLSAAGSELVTEEAFQAGVNYYLMKPFDRDILMRKIRHAGHLPRRITAGKMMEVPRPAVMEEPAVTKEEYMEEHLEADIMNWEFPPTSRATSI